MPYCKADVEGYVECSDENLPSLIALAERVDKFVGATPPENGYGLVEAFCSILNGGSTDEVSAALHLVTGWSFQPKGGWPK